MKILLQVLTWLAVIAICGTLYFLAVTGLTNLFSPPQEWVWAVKVGFFLVGFGFFLWASILGGLFFSTLVGAWYDSRFGYSARERRRRIKNMLRNQ